MTARHRERDLTTGKTGSKFYYLADPQTSFRTVAEGVAQVMDDHVGRRPYKPNPLDLEIVQTYHPTISGVEFRGSGEELRRYTAYPIDFYPAPTDPRDSFPYLDEIDRSNIGWELLAKTNVSQPHVDAPSFIGEAVESGIQLGLVTPDFVRRFGIYGSVPAIIRGVGLNILRAIASGYLSYRWMIRPLIHDVSSMTKFMEALERREFILTNALLHGSVKRRAGLGYEERVIDDRDVFLHTSGPEIRARRKVIHTSSMWGSVKWKLVGDGGIPSALDAEARRSFVRSLLRGYNTAGLTAAAWELTPWSWFIDWFAGLGTVLRATNNTVQMTWSENCLMRHTKSYTTYEIYDGSWSDHYTLSGVPVEIHERKERYLCAPVLPFIPSWQPLVNPRAWSIMASLAALRWVTKVAVPFKGQPPLRGPHPELWKILGPKGRKRFRRFNGAFPGR